MNDNNLRLNRIFAVASRPAYVKVGADETANASREAYGDPATLSYPCMSKSAAFCSVLLADEDGASDEVKVKLATYAKFWGIEDDVQEAREKLAMSRRQLTVDELPDGDFALLADYNGQKIRKFAAFDSNSTFDASIAFHENRHRYPYVWRKEAAVKLLERAQRFGSNLPEYVNEYLHKAAGFAVPTQESVDDAVIQRVNRAARADQDMAEKLGALLNEFAENPHLRYNAALVDEALKSVDSYDRETKLAALYGHGVDLPEEMLVWTEPKLAKMAGSSSRIVRLVNGHEVDVSEIGADTLDAVDGRLAKMSQARLTEVLPTLPKPEADLLVELMPKVATEVEPTGKTSPKTDPKPDPVGKANPAELKPLVTPGPKPKAEDPSAKQERKEIDEKSVADPKTQPGGESPTPEDAKVKTAADMLANPALPPALPSALPAAPAAAPNSMQLSDMNTTDEMIDGIKNPFYEKPAPAMPPAAAVSPMGDDITSAGKALPPPAVNHNIDTVDNGSQADKLIASQRGLPKSMQTFTTGR